MSKTPKCFGCPQVRGTPSGGLGPKRCKLDGRRRDIADYVHIYPSTGQPIASYIDRPQPDWCPRLTSMCCPASVDPDKPETWRHLVAYAAQSGERQAA
jgi:hypothetical protein